MSLSRRSLVKGTAWAAPVVLASTAVPTYAASKDASSGNKGGGSVVPTNPQPTETTPGCPAGTWHTGAKIVLTDPDYSNINYLDKVNYNTTPNGEAEMQHWYNGNSQRLHWRLHIGFPQGAEAGATITLPFHESWTNPSTPTQSGLQAFMNLHPKNAALYNTDLPTAVVAKTADSYVLTFTQAIPVGAAGNVEFNASPVGGDAAVKSGTPYEAWATVNFAPASC